MLNITLCFWNNSYCPFLCIATKQAGLDEISKRPRSAKQGRSLGKMRQEEKTMAKNYEYESKNTKNYAGNSSKNSSKSEMNRAENARNSKTTDCRDKAKNKTNDKTSQSYNSEETSRY